MRLKKIKLKNFKGIRKFSAEFGDYVEISGDNGTGKTTIFDAFVWLLFDKDSHYNGTQSFDIKTLDENNNPIHKLDHEVEGKFDTQDGELQLRKVYKEKWVKRRGAAEKEFNGHTSDYFIDDVPVNKSEYENKVNEIISEDKFKILTNPVYFNDELHWKDRRKILMELSNFNEDRLLEKEKYADLDISGTPESYLKKLKHKQKKINDNLEEIPVRISELRDAGPDNIKAKWLIETDIEELKKEKNEIEKEINNLNKESQREQLEYKLREQKQMKKHLIDQADVGYKEKKSMLKRKMKMLENSTGDIVIRIARLGDNEHQLEKEITSLKNSISEAEKEEFKDNKCPTCGQELPRDQLAEYRKKFNFEKSNRLERRKLEKKKAIEEKNQVEKDLDIARKEHAKEVEKYKQAEKKLKNLSRKDYCETEHLEKVKKKISEIEKKLENLPEEDISEQKEKLRKKKVEIETKIDEELKNKARLEQQQKINKRIEELEKQQKSNVKEYDKLEKQIHLTEKFIEEKVRAVNKEISKKFELVQFKLFEKQINGGLKPVCKTLYKGVPWNSLNTGARINAGLDQIRTLMDYYGVKVPIWIDNRESITNIIRMDTQIFNLIVQEGEPLKVESFAKAKE